MVLYGTELNLFQNGPFFKLSIEGVMESWYYLTMP